MSSGKLRHPDVNITFLSCRLTRDADFGERTDATPYLSLDVVWSRKRKRRDKSEYEEKLFKRVIVYRGVDWLRRELRKGRSILVEGYEKTDEWIEKGKPRSRSVLYANSIQLLDYQDDFSRPEPALPTPNQAPAADDDDDFPF